MKRRIRIAATTLAPAKGGAKLTVTIGLGQAAPRSH